MEYNPTKLTVIISLLLFLVAGSFLRLWELSSQSYWMDEGYTVNAVLSIAETGSTVLDSGQYYKCPTYCYPTAFLAEQLGDNPASYRLLAALSGISLILLLFYVTRKLFTTNIALLTSFFLTFSYWQIVWSRQARWYTLFTAFFWLALYFFYTGRQQTGSAAKNYLLTAFFTILAIITHGLGYLLPLIFILWVAVEKIILIGNFTFRSTGKLLLPLVIFLIIAEQQIGIVSRLSFHYELPYYLSFYLRTYWLIIALGVYSLFSLSQNYQKPILFLEVIFLTYLIPLGFLTDIVHYRYLFHLTPIFFILGSAGILLLIDEVKSKTSKITISIVLLITFFTFGGGVIIPTDKYFLESDQPSSLGTRPHYAYTPQPDWRKAYELIENTRIDEDIIVSSHPQFNKIFLQRPGYWIKYNYLGHDNHDQYQNNDREYYVNAQIIDDLRDFEETIMYKHGFVVFDYMAADGRIPEEILTYIESNFLLVFYEKTNPTSEVWVYRF